MSVASRQIQTDKMFLYPVKGGVASQGCWLSALSQLLSLPVYELWPVSQTDWFMKVRQILACQIKRFLSLLKHNNSLLALEKNSCKKPNFLIRNATVPKMLEGIPVKKIPEVYSMHFLFCSKDFCCSMEILARLVISGWMFFCQIDKQSKSSPAFIALLVMKLLIYNQSLTTDNTKKKTGNNFTILISADL